MDAVLEAPYVLGTGLGEARSLSHSGRESFFVAAREGVWELDAEGRRTLVAPGEAEAVTAHPGTLYVLGGGALRWGPLPAAGQQLQEAGRQPAPGVRDLLAWCDGSVLLAGNDEITALNVQTGESWAFALGLEGLRALALGPGDGCDHALVVAGARVLAVNPAGARPLAEGLVAPRAAALDARGRLWVVAGEPPELLRVEDGRTTVFARFLGDPRDLIAGLGGLLPPANLYLADGEGTVDYVHAP